MAGRLIDPANEVAPQGNDGIADSPHRRRPTMADHLIDRNPDILGGTPVFSGTRIPLRTLMEHPQAGYRIDEFLDDDPWVSRDRAVELLARAATTLPGDPDESAA